MDTIPKWVISFSATIILAISEMLTATFALLCLAIGAFLAAITAGVGNASGGPWIASLIGGLISS